jgi:hypothetical protein
VRYYPIAYPLAVPGDIGKRSKAPVWIITEPTVARIIAAVPGVKPVVKPTAETAALEASAVETTAMASGVEAAAVEATGVATAMEATCMATRMPTAMPTAAAMCCFGGYRLGQYENASQSGRSKAHPACYADRLHVRYSSYVAAAEAALM